MTVVPFASIRTNERTDKTEDEKQTKKQAGIKIETLAKWQRALINTDSNYRAVELTSRWGAEDDGKAGRSRG